LLNLLSQLLSVLLSFPPSDYLFAEEFWPKLAGSEDFDPVSLELTGVISFCDSEFEFFVIFENWPVIPVLFDTSSAASPAPNASALAASIVSFFFFFFFSFGCSF